MGYPIFALIPTHLSQIISHFYKPTHPPNRGISYVDDPLGELTLLRSVAQFWEYFKLRDFETNLPFQSRVGHSDEVAKESVRSRESFKCMFCPSGFLFNTIYIFSKYYFMYSLGEILSI